MAKYIPSLFEKAFVFEKRLVFTEVLEGSLKRKSRYLDGVDESPRIWSRLIRASVTSSKSFLKSLSASS